MATLLIDQWIAANGPLPPLTFASGLLADNMKAMDAQAFRNRISMATVNAAVAIANEATTTPDHANRAGLAKAVLGSPQAWVIPFAMALASQGLDETSADGAINTGIASVWNAIAG